MTQMYGGIFSDLSTQDYRFLNFLTQDYPYRDFDEEPGLPEMSTRELLNKVNTFRDRAKVTISSFAKVRSLTDYNIKELGETRAVSARLDRIVKKLESRLKRKR